MHVPHGDKLVPLLFIITQNCDSEQEHGWREVQPCEICIQYGFNQHFSASVWSTLHKLQNLTLKIKTFLFLAWLCIYVTGDLVIWKVFHMEIKFFVLCNGHSNQIRIRLKKNGPINLARKGRIDYTTLFCCCDRASCYKTARLNILSQWLC